MNYRPKPNPFESLRNSPSSHNRGGLGYMTTMEREKQREKERQSRQQQVQSENNVKDKKELFGSPVKVDDANDDEQSQLIQSQLGSFDDAKPFLDLVFSCGMTGMPPSPAPPPPQSSSSSSSAAASGMMHLHSSSYASSAAAAAAAAAKSHHHAAAAGQQQSSRRSESPASGSVPAAVASFKKPTVTSHAMARSSSGGGSSSSASHFQSPVNPPRNSNFLKPGEMKPPSYSSMGRSTSGGGSSSSSMRSSHSSHHRAPHKPNNNLAVSNNHNSNNDTNTPSTIEDILNEMTVGLPLVSDIAETPRVTIVDSKYTADGKVEPQQRMSPKDASESLKKMLGEPKPLFAEPVQHRSGGGGGGNQHQQQPSSRGVSPDAASSAAAAAASMDAKPSGPYNHSLFASYMVKPSVRGSNIMPQPQQSMMQESQQQSSPSADKMRRSSTSANLVPSDPATTPVKIENAGSEMSVDEDSSSSEEGEKDSSSDSSCSDSESNDETNKKDEQPAAMSPPQQEEEQPRWNLKNFLKRSTPDTNNATRAPQQDESIGMTDPKSSPGFLQTQRSEVNEISEMSDDSDSNHSDKQKSQSDSSSSSSTSSSSSEDEDDKKKKNSESSCDSDSSCSSRSRASAKPVTDLHQKYSTLAKYEKKDIKKSFEKPAKPTEKKQSTPVIPKKEEPVDEPLKKRRGRKKGSTNTPKPPPPSKIKSKPLISSDSEDDEEPAPKPKINEKRRGRPPGKKTAKVISASSESEEWTDSSRKSRKKDSEKKSSSHHSVKKTPSWEKNPPQKPVARVSAALRPPRSVSSSVDSDSSDVECRPPPISTATESPPKLDVEGIKVQDKKKNDTLRKLFRTRREEGVKIGGKSKGGKGGKGGVIIIDNNEAMRNDNERVISPVPVIPPMAKEPEGPKSLSMMSIPCSIPLSKLPNLNYLLKSVRSKELRTCADLANTRQTEEKKPKHRHHKHHHKGSPAQSVSGSEKSKANNESQANTVPPTQPLLQQPSSDGYTKGMMDNVNVWRKPTSVCAVIPEAKVKPLEHNTMSYLQRPSTGSGLMHPPYEDSSEDEDGTAPFLGYGPTAVQIMDPRYKRSLELDQYPPPNATKRRKFHNPPGPATLGRYGTAMGDGLINDIFVDHEVPIQPPPRQPSWRMQSMHHQYPPRKRFFSYFVTDLYPENNSMHQEVPLKEAQALTKLAEYEPDPITQEMKYLDGILCFVLSGYLMENDGTRERAVLKIYNDTIDLIKVIWSKIYNYRADCDHEELEEIFEMANNPERDNRLLILWMRCLSFLRLKLYRLLTYQHRPSFKTVQQHFLKNVGSSPISPSPSPASSVESHSSGYCSSSITPSGVAASSGPPTGVIGVPVAAHTALHSEHILFCHLAAAHEMWYRADMLVMRGKHTQFFVEMDRHCGPLTLHSTGYDLTLYARIAISRMRCEFNIKNYLP
ncbi:Hypothetical protein CINCED_3A023406 [Cinara cedri]|uniref:AF4/FMR2 family member lilli n=1 Tax=Cinara cedri TaxID=506608 RepID=A0A5E4M2R0_9HEMI|nr:Hypothetical protein CINCED_3A023406 [Cinara cedri]